MGLQDGSPFWGAFFSPYLSLPLALDSALLVPTWGAQHNCRTALILTDRRRLGGSHCVCSLSPDGHWLPGAASSRALAPLCWLSELG